MKYILKLKLINMDYQLIIIWTWSAWYPAWMYASRYKVKNLIIWWEPGWALATSHKVENYPGVLSAPGKSIMDDFKKHSIAFGSEILQDMVTSLEKIDDWFKVKTWLWKEFTSKKIILATWNSHRHLNAPWENEFLWKWVSYCATCDWMFYKSRDVVVVWWWNTAVTESLYLADICNKVYILNRSESFKCETVWWDEAKKRPNIEIITNEEVWEIKWNFFVEEIALKSWKSIKADWIFIAVWTLPNNSLVKEIWVEFDNEGCVVVDKRQETKVKWLYAAWDITTNSNKFKQTIMSAAEWCLAANSVHEDLLKE